MSTPTPATTPDGHPLHPPADAFDLRRVAATYFWFILKNVVGWICILGSPILGVLVPGPGGIPVFLIGFALVTLPGKRRLTSRFMRGGQLPIDSPLFSGIITFFSVLVTLALMYLAWRHFEWLMEQLPLQQWGVRQVAHVLGVSVLALPVTMAMTWLGLRVLNLILGWIPRIRRYIRPALRKWGIRLLPTRRRRVGGRTQLVHDEILSLEEGQRKRLRLLWIQYGPWLRRMAAVTLTIVILYFVVSPVLQNWSLVERQIGRVHGARLILAVVMFAAGLLLFRAAAWRTILRRMNERIPWTSAGRIWSLGHLARFIPGRLHEVLRTEMARPYGPSSVEASVATRLEGMLSMAGALVVGLSAFWIALYVRAGEGGRAALLLLAALSPAILILTVPSIFYRLLPARTGLGRGGAGTQMTGGWLLALFLWLTAGIIWQGTTVWLLIGPILQEGGMLWLIAGAWALAWVAGQLAPWSPGGLGVREVVFVGVLSLLVPRELRERFQVNVPFTLWSPDSWQDVWWAFLFFLSLLLRIATTTAEVLVAVATTMMDWRGMRRMLHS